MMSIGLLLILCFFRVASFVAFLPPFGGQHVPKTVKVGLAIALTAFWAPSVTAHGVFSSTPSATSELGIESSIRHLDEMDRSQNMRPWLLWTWLASREVLLGAALGWLLGTILVPFRVAGSWLGELMGISIASITSGADSSSGNVLAVMLEAIGVLLLFSLSIHHGFLLIFDQCWDTFEVGGVWGSTFADTVIGLLTGLSNTGLALVAPTALMMTISTIVLLFAMKQAPQFNLFTFGMPYRLLAGLVALVMFFPDLMGQMSDHLQSFLNISG